MHKKNIVFSLSAFLISLSVSCIEPGNSLVKEDADKTTQSGDKPPTFPNHHLHNFQGNAEKLPIQEHAVAMGYRYVVNGKPDGERYANLQLIGNTNASICPIRVHKEKATGKTFISYLEHFSDANNLNTIAAVHGLRRVCGKQMEMTEADLNILKWYAAAKLPIDDLTLDNANYDEIFKRFHPKWIIDGKDFVGFNLSMNWINRAVIANCTKAFIEGFQWKRFQALFFDSLNGGSMTIETTNKDALPGGHFPTREAGQLEFLTKVCEFARDPSKTGQPYPYLITTNIYDALGKSNLKTTLAWYGRDILRFDHYYLEAGASRNIVANGTVPGTTEPAYVDFGTDALPDAYLPANLLAFDDYYGWSRLQEYLQNFDHDAFLLQHLDMAGKAAIQGSWFGWYGEDMVDRRDGAGRLIYSNANQLLRALPNWDNMAGIPVPRFNDYRPDDQRKLEGQAYSSPNSFLSPDIVYSRNPENGELYVVFLNANGFVKLKEGEQIASAVLANQWFVETSTSILPSLTIEANKTSVRLNNSSLIGKGIRIKLK